MDTWTVVYIVSGILILSGIIRWIFVLKMSPKERWQREYDRKLKKFYKDI